ncbi:mas-related G-protein coupled receptor member H-like [Eublepharis macularius]|uniref:Mas-related G-protein coupled receptor member H-like n=1 Tax=Eublepharis macularius TaxID=481883 RepID=A0AA97L4M0_EUBMA|nr:mas-related G-protein coupled receptor member H-like [Eublepharis macularius]
MTTENTSSVGFTLEREDFSSTEYGLAIYILTAFFCLCGLVGNGKVIWLLSLYIQRTYFITYILNLAIADFGTLLALFIRLFALSLHKASDFALSFLYSLFFFTHSTSLYLLTVISMERCLAVLLPVWYQRRRRGHASVFVSFLLWVFSGLLSGGLLLFCHVLSFKTTYLIMTNIICSLNMLIFTPFMVASTLTLFIKICCHSQGHHPPKVYSVILLALLFFIIFAIPLSAVHVVLIYSKHYSRLAIEISVLCASFNSSVNPLIYCFIGRDKNHWCKDSMKVVLQRIFKDETESRTSESAA